MLIDFQLGNYKSFRDIQQLSMQASPIRSNDDGLQEDNVFSANNIRLLKSKAIFGQNGSGKSNLLKAFAAFAYMVSRSVTEEEISKSIWNDRFGLITDWDDQPVFFQCTFIFESTIYRYGFQILKGKIVYEWLFGKKGRKREDEYFMRHPEKLALNEKYFETSNDFVNQALKGSNELFRSDSLFLTASALNGTKLTMSIRNYIKDIIFVDGIQDNSAINYTIDNLEQGTKERVDAIKAFMRATDTGVEDLRMLVIGIDKSKNPFGENSQNSKVANEVKVVKTLFSTHSRYDENGILVDKVNVPFGEWESDGTGKIFAISAIILEALTSGRMFVIDEFDARLHPNITLKILQMFNARTTNPKNAQLLIVTHDTGLLRRAGLRRDQICLVDKDKYGISTMRTLIEYKGVRKDTSFEKEYLNGKFSAVPFLDSMDFIQKPNTK